MIVLDGAMGTLLESQGYDTGGPEWASGLLRTTPGAIAANHAAYAQAGAIVHTAMTFRATHDPALTRLAVEVARAAVPPEHRVFASIAPLHDCYERPSAEPERSAYMPHVAAASASGADGLLLETFADPAEAVLVGSLARESDLPVWIALSPGWRGDLLSADEIRHHLVALRRVSDAVLINCAPLHGIERWTNEVRRDGGAWGVFPNGGSGENALETQKFDQSVGRWMDQGAHVIGGCCGTNPGTVRRIANLLRDRLNPAFDEPES